MATAAAVDHPVVTQEVPGPEPDLPDGTEHPDGAPRAGGFRLALLGVLVVALVASVAPAAVLWSHRRGHADALQSQREAVMAQTQQFVLRANTYDPSMLDAQGTMPAYRSRVEAVITPKLAASFEQGAADTEQTVRGYHVSRHCAVYATGVEVIDADSAEVLVAGSISETRRASSGKQVPCPHL